MPTQEKNRACLNLVRKLTTGESLEHAEKSHLAVCETCMAEVVKTLDEAAASAPPGHDIALDGMNGHFSHSVTKICGRRLTWRRLRGGCFRYAIRHAA